MAQETLQTDPEKEASMLSRIATGVQILAILIILGGWFVTADGVYPIVSTTYAEMLAVGALVFAASSHFEVKSLEARLEARER